MNNRTWFCILFLFTLSSVVSCERVSSQDGPSKFYAEFSLSSVIRAHEDYLLERGGATGEGEETSSWKGRRIHQKDVDTYVDIEDRNKKPFFEALRADIEDIIKNSGATIKGKGEGTSDTGESFSFNYTDGHVYGTINIWGVHGEGSQFIIIGLITEVD